MIYEVGRLGTYVERTINVKYRYRQFYIQLYSIIFCRLLTLESTLSGSKISSQWKTKEILL